MRLDAPARNEQGPPAASLRVRDDVDGGEPALVGIPARHLGQQRAIAKASAQLAQGLAVRRIERIRRQAVGNHQRVHPQRPHPLAHVAAHRRQHRGAREARPGDAVEAEGVVGIPQEADLVSQAGGAEPSSEVEHRVRRVPLLGQDDPAPSRPQVRAEDLAHEIRGERRRVLEPFPLLAVVDPARVMAAHPLSPAVQVERPLILVAGQVRVSDEPEVGLEAQAGQRAGKPLDARGDAPGSRVRVGALEGEDVKLQRDRLPGPAGL